METRLLESIRDTDAGRAADRILRACVHCGFCLATCPTYQLLGDELDSPRGRIYQIKQVLEGAPPTRAAQVHLDRCLTCRSCETTCPSGVEYGQLLDIGRAVLETNVERPLRERLYRWLLREGLTRSGLFVTALRLARSLRWMLTPTLRAKVGCRRPTGRWPVQEQGRKVLLLKGCAQPALLPSIDFATARVLERIGVQALIEPRSGCCGAVRHHLTDTERALHEIRRNVDAWWPHIESGRVEAIVVNASGCGVMVKDYANLLNGDPRYAARARRVAELTQDPSEFLARELAALQARESLTGALAGHRPSLARRVAFHSPCTLQHGLRIRGLVEGILRALGAELVPVADAHLCCGSAGTYSLLQGGLAADLRGRKLTCLMAERPEIILSANIGCIAHLQAASPIPVHHWVEWVDEALAGEDRAAVRTLEPSVSQIGKNGVTLDTCRKPRPSSPS